MYAFHLVASIMFFFAFAANLFSSKGTLPSAAVDLGFAVWGFATLPHS